MSSSSIIEFLGRSVGRSESLLVRLVGDEEGGVDGLHAGRAGEAPHEPVVDALGVVGVHARKVADAVADAELDHADHAPEKKERERMRGNDFYS